MVRGIKLLEMFPGFFQVGQSQVMSQVQSAENDDGQQGRPNSPSRIRFLRRIEFPLRGLK
jgi:hypothetical protein